MIDRTRDEQKEEGFVLVALLMALIPLVTIVGAATLTVNGRSNRLQEDLLQERALLACESGLDEAIYKAQTGSLTSGVSFKRALAGGIVYTVTPTWLGGDLKDNDGDLLIDAADPDEDVFQVEVAGTFRNTTRKIAAYLGPTSMIASVDAAVTVYNPGIDIQFNGNPGVTGDNYNLDGSRGSVANDKLGMVITTPGTVANLLSTMSGSEQAQVTGTGGTPSVGTTTGPDLTALVTTISNTAGRVLTNNKYSGNFTWGTAGSPEIVYRNGDLRLSGSAKVRGLMVVTGDLTMTGTFDFEGIIIVLGSLDGAKGTPRISGGLILGPSSSELIMKGTADINYSQEAIDMLGALGGEYVTFNGWQELAR